MVKKQEATDRLQSPWTFWLTAEENNRLNQQAIRVGIPVSEYTQRLFFSGRPIIVKGLSLEATSTVVVSP